MLEEIKSIRQEIEVQLKNLVSEKALEEFRLKYLVKKGSIQSLFERLKDVPKEQKPIVDFLKPQGRFKHLFKPENEALLAKIQADIDREWAKLQKEETCFAS